MHLSQLKRTLSAGLTTSQMKWRVHEGDPEAAQGGQSRGGFHLPFREPHFDRQDRDRPEAAFRAGAGPSAGCEQARGARGARGPGCKGPGDHEAESRDGGERLPQGRLARNPQLHHQLPAGRP